MGKIEILRAGPLTTVQDLGRYGHREEGIAPGGALDSHAARVANLLVGNPEESALLEITWGPCRLRFADERLVACVGAETGMSLGKPRRMRADEELELRVTGRGCRIWLAVAGGIDLPLVLGSRATDLRGGYGGCAGRALRDGDELPLGAPVRTFSGKIPDWRAPNEWSRTASFHPLLRILPGAEWQEFAPGARLRFLEEGWQVTEKADRMGARLRGPELTREREDELFSEGITPGTIQVTPDRQPILLLGDCQTLGGYPKIAHVITVDLAVAAQLRPADTVHFRLVRPEEAEALFRARERELELFRVALQLRAS